MRTFKEFIKARKVLKRRSDPAEAKALLLQARRRLNDLQALPLTKDNASFRFEHAYESIREAVQCFLSIEGYKPYTHEAIISFARDRHLLDEPAVHQADRYREIRNDINYRGKSATLEEAKEIISFVKKVLPQLEKEFEKRSY